MKLNLMLKLESLKKFWTSVECSLCQTLQRTFYQRLFPAKCFDVLILVASRWSTHIAGLHLSKSKVHKVFVTCAIPVKHVCYIVIILFFMAFVGKCYFSLSCLLPQADLIPGVPRVWISVVRPWCSLHSCFSAVWQNWNWNHFLWYGAPRFALSLAIKNKKNSPL